MPASIVIGGQFGSEGKGKVAHYFARELKASFAVRCGGPNAGHTVVDERGCVRIFQQLPTAVLLPNVKLVICAGSYIDLDILYKEIEETGVGADRLFIDPAAVIITDKMQKYERQSGLKERIGSTGSGTGAAVAARINREESLLFAKNILALTPFVADTQRILRTVLACGERIIIEGTQGFGLSSLHSGYFPYTTSRDTTAAAFLSETGLSPFDVDDIILTIRTFPIRVSGFSGFLNNEINWDTVTTEGKHKNNIVERTSVTKCIRRVGRFSADIVKRAIIINKPTKIVLNHLDYIYEADRNAFVKQTEAAINRSIGYVGLSPSITEPIAIYHVTV